VRNYGTHYPRILKLAADEPALARCVAGTHVSLAEVAYVCRQELAVTLGDVLFRRTEIATSEAPQPAAIAEVERVLRDELALDERELERQREWVSSHLLRYRASVRPTTSRSLAGAA
jgi:glycerol-3-phosphate dehydrogenase